MTILMLRRYIQIDFTKLRLNLCLPPSVTCKNGAIRAIWLDYDHLSDLSPSFKFHRRRKLQIGECIKHSFVIHQFVISDLFEIDLNTAARREWKLRKKEMEMIIRNLDEKCGKAMKQEEVTGEEEESSNDEKEIAKNGEQRKTSTLNDPIKLKDFELNLRKYQIVGGIFNAEMVDQPQQNIKLSAGSFLKTSNPCISSPKDR